MSVVGLLIGVLNCVLLVAVLVLIGALVVWVASIFEWPIPWNIQRIYLLICLLVFIICVISLIAGAPMVHFLPLGRYGQGALPQVATLDLRIFTMSNISLAQPASIVSISEAFDKKLALNE